MKKKNARSNHFSNQVYVCSPSSAKKVHKQLGFEGNDPLRKIYTII